MSTKIKWESNTMKLAEFLENNFGWALLDVVGDYGEDGDIENMYRFVQDNMEDKEIKEEVELLLYNIKK